MRYHLITKFLAVLLCSCLLLTCVAGIAGIVLLENMGLYSRTLEELQYESSENSLYTLATRLAQRYAAENLGDCPPGLLAQYYADGDTSLFLDTGLWFYTIADRRGTVLFSTYAGQTGVTAHRITVAPYYPSVIYHYTSSVLPEGLVPGELPPTTQTTQPTEDAPEEETDPEKEPEEEFLYTEGFGFYDTENQIQHNYQLGFRKSDEYTVTLYLLPGAYLDTDTAQWQTLGLLMHHRYSLFYLVGFALLAFAALAVFLCCIAGREPSGKIAPKGLSLAPLDLYAGIAVLWGIFAGGLIRYTQSWLMDASISSTPVIAAVALSFLMCLVTVAFLYAAAAQSKMERSFWWKNCILVRLAAALGKLCRLGFRGCLSLMEMLPVVWRWLILVLGVLLYFAAAFLLHSPLMAVIGAILTAALVGYMAWCYGRLYKAAHRMSQGNLSAQLSREAMVGSFRSFAGNLNSLADTAAQEASRRMQSERMRAELITNVSHDIRTPLTSIINYVDLLQSADSREQAQSHLEVLGRQSQRLKKLIDDLMELSKASTGNIPVEIGEAGAVEAVTQALGEFSDQLEQAQLTPVFNPPAEEVYILCDGRLTWRVLSNLLNNAVKYAMPGTRLYIDLDQQGAFVSVSLKNISRQQLTVSAEELLERFVRGDTSRNTEGSGLGLNIAKSLMELQHGQFHLELDGDQFKITLLFPTP